MGNFTIGDFICLKSHPYFQNNPFIKISANADMTPPVMVIAEILDKDEYESSTGKMVQKQFKCFYYSHKDCKYYDKWFKENEIKKLNPIKTYLDLNTLNLIEDFDLEFLKTKYIGQLACLKSVDFELNKKKVFIDNSNGNRTNKENNHLDFLPPVMTIIDIIKNKEEKKYSTKNKKIIEKDCGKYLFKCKWYNNHTASYSEDLLPSGILGLISANRFSFKSLKKIIDRNLLILCSLNKEIFLENTSIKIKRSIVDVREIVLNHYYYKIGYYDTLSQKNDSSRLSNIYFSSKIYYFKLNQLLDKKLPKIQANKLIPIKEKDFVKGEYYLIKYVDRFDKISTRTIKTISNIKVNMPITNSNQSSISIIIQANCLLRNGQIRHFNLERIISSQHIVDGIKLFES